MFDGKLVVIGYEVCVFVDKVSNIEQVVENISCYDLIFSDFVYVVGVVLVVYCLENLEFFFGG